MLGTVSSNGRPNGEGTSRGAQPQFTRMTKIEFLKFGGDVVRGWFYKCEQFFEIDHVMDPHKVQLASIHLYDTASLWHRQFVKLMDENASWNSFKEGLIDKEVTILSQKFCLKAIMLRFGSAYDDPMGDIKNLRHTSTIEEYQNAFDMLLSRIDFPKDQQVSCYIVGLQSEVELAVRMFRPKTLVEVYHLSKVQKDAIKEEAIGEVIEYSQISLHALNGVEFYQTMRVTGHKVGCHLISTYPLQVDIAGGAKLTSNYRCKKFVWQTQGQEFVIDATTLPLGRCDMVLGIQLLSTLGNILFNFKELKMEFKYEGRKTAQLTSMVLCVYPSTSLNMISAATTEGTPTPITISNVLHPPTQKDGIEVMVKELLESGVIRPSQSPFSSPVVMLDLRSGYHQIRMCQDDVKKTAFRTHEDHYEFLVMPFSLTNAPSTFQALMNFMFKKYLRRSHTLFAKQSKCMFGTKRVEYLGHVIPSEGVATDHTKIEAMQQWLIPANLKQLRGFWGLTGYYKRFIKGYDAISHPLTKLMKKNAFIWLAEAQTAFIKLKEAMINAPVLKLPNFNAPFVVETDASGEGICAVLQQDGHPIAYFSKTLAPKRHALSTYEKELLAVIQALHNDNWAADALSRVNTGGQLLQMVLTSVTTDLLPKIVQSWDNDHILKTLIQNLKAGKPVRSKPDLSSYPGLLQPLPIPTLIWSEISMDFVEGLSNSNGKIVIMVVVDILTKYNHFIALSHPFTAIQVAQKELFKMLQVSLHFPTAYHPQTDGQTENIGTTPISILPAIRTTPFEVVYGQPHSSPILCSPDQSNVDSVDMSLSAREAIVKMLQFHLEKAQARMKAAVDLHRTDRSFAEGQWVWLKLQPHRQIRVRKEKYNKLLPNAMVHGSMKDATWELATDLKKRFLEFSFNSRGQELFQGGDIDMDQFGKVKKSQYLESQHYKSQSGKGGKSRYNSISFILHYHCINTSF
ncbi:putative mitochondrial protein [Tanacetum coccineum]